MSNVGPEQGFRLSPQQARYCALAEASGAAAFESRIAALLDEAIDVTLLESAAAALCDRYEILRTMFQHVSGMDVPVQVIRDRAAAVVTVIPAAEATCDASERAYLEEQLRRNDLAPVEAGVRINVYTFPSGRSGLVLALPFGCMDSTGMRLLLGELIRKPERDEDEPPIQYADVAEWQNELLESEEAQEGIRHWRRAAQELDSAPGWPFPPVQKSTPGLIPQVIRESFPVPPDLWTAEPHELLAVLTTAWVVLLQRLTRRTDCLVGVVLDGRHYEGLEGVLGVFERTLPIRIETGNAQPLEKLRNEVADELALASGFQEYFSWDTLSRSLRSGAEPEFLRYVCALHDRRVSAWPERAPRIIHVVEHACPDRFYVYADWVWSENDLNLNVYFDPSVVSRSTAAEIPAWLATIVNQLTHAPDKVVSTTELLDEAAVSTSVALMRGPEEEWDRSHTVLDWFEQHALAKPDRVAVESPESAIPYHELRARALELAMVLKSRGVQPGDRVGLCAGRSVELVAGMLGIMAARAAYVPFDPTYPSDRHEFIAADVEARVILVQRALADKVAHLEIPVVYFDEIPSASAGAAAEPGAFSDVVADDPAYVIYTSGSTGQPKGVPISQANLTVSTAARHSRYVEPPDRFLLLSSYAFDSSVAGVFWTLTTGGTLVLPPEGAEREPAEIAALVGQKSISTLLCLPSVYGMVLNFGRLEQFASLRTVIVAGESCTIKIVRDHETYAGHARLFNEYGPTECTVWASVHECHSEDEHQYVPIGKPISNTQICVLDPNQKWVPAGLPGEVYIGGPGLARGYLNRAEATAERFVHIPTTGGPAQRMYRTGDLARYDGKGVLEFLGRTDQQVKLRGYRIELEEIEQVLKRCAGVRDAVVSVRQFGRREDDVERLVAALEQIPAPHREQLIAQALSEHSNRL